MAVLTALHTAVPHHVHNQHDIATFMSHYLSIPDVQGRQLNWMYRRSGIKTRYSCLPDFSSSSAYLFDNQEFVSIDTRMALYEKEALKLSLEAIQPLSLEGITHLVTVSCTGMVAPGLDIQLVKALGLCSQVVRTSVNFMGCYGALHGLKLAQAFCDAQKNARVLVVCTELCTLHLQRATDWESLTSALLFGDGSAACIVESDSGQPGMVLTGFFSDIAISGEEDMAWRISSTGFLMRLSSEIPKKLKIPLASLVQRALGDELKQVDWLIHPGGKDILEATQKALGLESSDLTHSYQVLKDFGNMSSPTILFVLAAWMKTNPNNRKAFLAAFGPGITLESLLIHTRA